MHCSGGARGDFRGKTGAGRNHVDLSLFCINAPNFRCVYEWERTRLWLCLWFCFWFGFWFGFGHMPVRSELFRGKGGVKSLPRLSFSLLKELQAGLGGCQFYSIIFPFPPLLFFCSLNALVMGQQIAIGAVVIRGLCAWSCCELAIRCVFSPATVANVTELCKRDGSTGIEHATSDFN